MSSNGYYYTTPFLPRYFGHTAAVDITEPYTPQFYSLIPYALFNAAESFPMETSTSDEPSCCLPQSNAFTEEESHLYDTSPSATSSLPSFNSSADSILPIGDKWSPTVSAEPKFYPGILAPSRRGRDPVLIYRIPKSFLCYVYNRVSTKESERLFYLCRECYLKGKFLIAKITSQCYFMDDPVLAGHICRPKSFKQELTRRQVVVNFATDYPAM